MPKPLTRADQALALEAFISGEIGRDGGIGFWGPPDDPTEASAELYGTLSDALAAVRANRARLAAIAQRRRQHEESRAQALSSGA
jgi:hypothetical protein